MADRQGLRAPALIASLLGSSMCIYFVPRTCARSASEAAVQARSKTEKRAAAHTSAASAHVIRALLAGADAKHRALPAPETILWGCFLSLSSSRRKICGLCERPNENRPAWQSGTCSLRLWKLFVRVCVSAALRVTACETAHAGVA